MPKVKLTTVVEGDILSGDVVVEDTMLFEAGTVLVPKTIRILDILGVRLIDIEPRLRRVFASTADVVANIDERFSYVAGDPFMDALKNTLKDIILTLRAREMP